MPSTKARQQQERKKTHRTSRAKRPTLNIHTQCKNVKAQRTSETKRKTNKNKIPARKVGRKANKLIAQDISKPKKTNAKVTHISGVKKANKEEKLLETCTIDKCSMLLFTDIHSYNVCVY